MMKKFALLAVLAAAGLAQADVEVYSGTLDQSDPTFNRPFTDFSGLSGVGTNVAYEVQPLFVAADGSYDFNSSHPSMDGYLLLYANSFDPNNALVNGVAGNDDGNGGIGTSDFSASLTAGVQYYLVMTTYSNSTYGDYTNTISGQGDVTLGLVPAPASAALLGLGGLIAARRRRA